MSRISSTHVMRRDMRFFPVWKRPVLVLTFSSDEKKQPCGISYNSVSDNAGNRESIGDFCG